MLETQFSWEAFVCPKSIFPHFWHEYGPLLVTGFFFFGGRRESISSSDSESEICHLWFEKVQSPKTIRGPIFVLFSPWASFGRLANCGDLQEETISYVAHGATFVVSRFGPTPMRRDDQHYYSYALSDILEINYKKQKYRLHGVKRDDFSSQSFPFVRSPEEFEKLVKVITQREYKLACYFRGYSHLHPKNIRATFPNDFRNDFRKFPSNTLKFLENLCACSIFSLPGQVYRQIIPDNDHHPAAAVWEELKRDPRKFLQ